MKERLKAPELRFNGFTDDWEERKLTDLATTYIGLVTTMTENYTTEGTLLIRNSDIKEGRFDLSNPIYLEKQFAEKNKTRRMRKGDVVTVHTGDIGTSAIINSELDGTIGFATITTRPKKELDSNFLAWYFNSNYHKKYAKRMSTGDGRSNYNMKDFNKNVIPTPKIAEQQKIGSFFKQLDETLDLHQRKLDLLKEQKKGFLQKMFPKNGEKVPELRFEGFTDDWELRKLDKIIDVHSGRDYKHLNKGNIPVYGTGGYMLSVNEALSEKTDAIGIGRKGTIDKPYLLKAPFWTVDTLFYATLQTNIDLQFTLAIFKKINWKKYDESTGVPSLSKSVINNVFAFLPSFKEQKKIGSFFQQLDDTITLHQRKLDLLKEQKKGYLQKMFI